jgi:hypothetical protein
MILLSYRNWQKKEETGRVTFSCIADFAASRPSRYSGVYLQMSTNKGLVDPSNLHVLGWLKKYERVEESAVACPVPRASAENRDERQFSFDLTNLVKNEVIPGFHENTQVGSNVLFLFF